LLCKLFFNLIAKGKAVSLAQSRAESWFSA
jgi:hypothetical protein